MAYEFTSEEIDKLYNATLEVHNRCLDLVNDICNKNPHKLDIMGIPKPYHNYIINTWNRGDPMLYGRFDFAFKGGDSEPKMLEYNADTPTMVIETALMQWFWLQDVKPGSDQFNSLHEHLLEQFKFLKTLIKNESFYFACYTDNEEEYKTCQYFQDLATQAGVDAKIIDINQIGWDGAKFVDMDNKHMKFWFKLYPWEWMLKDQFGINTIGDSSGIVEPCWKMLLSNKAMLPMLHELFPNHPNIPRASFTKFEGDLVEKPFLSREGSNIKIIKDNKIVQETQGLYASDNVIYQEFAETFNQDGFNAILGCWMVGNEPCGMIVRDHNQLIVQERSRVVPHYFG